VFRGKSVLAVVPARGGSKGIKLKNIFPLAGKPLIAYTAEVVRQLSYIDRAVVSTDSPEIARVAGEWGLSAPFSRPESISGDRIGDWDVLHHALLEMEKRDRRIYDVVLMLQPTSPLRKPEQVTRALTKLLECGYDAVWTVSPTDSKAHPLKQLTLRGDRLEFYDPAGRAVRARQELEPVYHRNGVAYALTRRCLVELGSIWGERASAVVIDEPLANIDTLEDIRWAEYQLGRGRRPQAEPAPGEEAP
jgi:CMP-N,N'-diacetyllegionaminic acid synthase